jgi:ketosteroid isomerase-like protein
MTHIPRILIRCLIVLALLVPLLAQNNAPAADSSIEAEVKALDAQLTGLLIKGDWKEYASHLTDGYSQTGQQLHDKQDVLAELQSGKVKYLYLTPDETQLRLYGDTAILNLHLTVVARENGRVTSASHRMTKVFVRQKGQWFLASLTDVPASH